MTTGIFWFRSDLRLHDNPAFCASSERWEQLVPVYCHGQLRETTRWGFPRIGVHRRAVVRAALDGLAAELSRLGSGLVETVGDPVDAICALAAELGVSQIHCEEIAAPEEQAQVEALRDRGLDVRSLWQATLFDQEQLPFELGQLPQQYTQFRVALEQNKLAPRAPLAIPARLPALPAGLTATRLASVAESPLPDSRSAFPYQQPPFNGSEASALDHLRRYFLSDLADSYKATRNDLVGTEYSTKLSPWLASGALSVRTAYASLADFERRRGRSDGSYWVWFELLWREHFRWLHRQHGRRLYRARGLRSQHEPIAHDTEGFRRWCSGQTGQPFVDAGMRELATTGYLSNRMRQVVASYLIHELNCDYRAGAAWFEAQLIDYDVYSNQGNWLYLAGRGTDPRGGRQFDPEKQARHYDRDGTYQALWSDQ